jgi:hypothetical protein
MYQTKREEKTNNQKVILIWLHTIKSFNNKNNEMAGITTYSSILTVNVNGLNYSIQDMIWQTALKKKIQQSVVYKRPTLLTDRNTGLR